MKTVILFILALVAIPAAVSAQTVPPIAGTNRKLAWDQDAPTLPDANSYVYRIYADAQTAPSILVGVLCVNPGTVGAPFVCQVKFPAFVPGNHVVTVTAGAGLDPTAESLPSTPFAFQFVVVPTSPKNVRTGS